MMPTRQGSFRLFRLFGVDVFLHWSWFFILFYNIQYPFRQYTSAAWNGYECIALFTIVLLHEFGHALACRQVGGTANQIVLWPLGGVAYVSPPQRAGAMLWSIAAGPLVNVALAPVLLGMGWLGHVAGWSETMPNVYMLVWSICFTNIVILIFNLLPVYPLDGGQILRSLLWFPFGRARSLIIATAVGFVGVAALITLAIWERAVWGGIMAVFILLNCWRGLMHARALLQLEKAPRRPGFACPACHAAPLMGALWGCGRCRKAFDTFETQASCPHCGTRYETTACAECGHLSPFSDWIIPPSLPPKG
jgi:Zn-dependent protease/DNA-directed RNA polymerase subunit RPC12/RpoP